MEVRNISKQIQQKISNMNRNFCAFETQLICPKMFKTTTNVIKTNIIKKFIVPAILHKNVYVRKISNKIFNNFI